MKIVLSTLILMSFVSCGQNAPEETLIKPAQPEKFQYFFAENGCDTGNHEYYYLDEVCEALLDDEINNNCASEKRQDLYEYSCQN